MLRDYQQELIDQTREAFRGHKSVVMQLPTGGGKTITTAWIIQNAKGRCIFCVHRIELLYQTSDTFKRMGIDHGFIAASEDYDPALRVHIASIDTLQRRLDDVVAPDLLVIDEAHRAMADGWRKVANYWPDAHRLLITATPERLDGRGLKHVAEVMVCGKSPRWLTEHGFLAPCRIFSPAVPDMAGIQTRGGDYAQEQLAAMMDKSTITGNAVEHYNKHCEGMQAIVFCVNIDHSRHVAAQFADAGIPAAHLDGTFGKIAREDIIERYRYGETRVLCNVNILTEGFDVPGVQAAIMLRPTKSLALYLQMCLDENTEILTSNGWMGIGKIKIGDCVPTLDMKTGKGRWSSVLGCTERRTADGELFVEYDAPRCNFRVTSGHDLLVSEESNGSYEKTEALKAAIKFRNKSMFVPTAVNIEQPGVPLTDSEIYFIGIFLTDGTINGSVVSIAQTNRHPEILERIETCLKNCNFGYRKYVTKKENIKSTVINGRPCIARHDRYSYVISRGNPRTVGKQGCARLLPFLDKDISAPLMSLSKRQFLILLQAIHDGDGYKKEKCPSIDYTPRSWSFCSARKEFMDKIQALSVIHGMTAHLRRESCGRKSPIYIATISPQDWRSIGGYGDFRPKLEVFESKNEKVWCIETDTGTIITRRNGKITVMGNCGRALRPMEGKTAIILDHAGNAIRHGHPSIDRDWSLEGKKGRKKNKVQLTTCEKCFCSWQKPPRECPNCGWVPETKEREINTESGTLSEITVEDNPWAWAKNRTLRDVLPRAQTYDDLLQIAKIRGYKSGWAYYQWKSRNQTSQG